MYGDSLSRVVYIALSQSLVITVVDIRYTQGIPMNCINCISQLVSSTVNILADKVQGPNIFVRLAALVCADMC